MNQLRGFGRCVQGFNSAGLSRPLANSGSTRETLPPPKMSDHEHNFVCATALLLAGTWHTVLWEVQYGTFVIMAIVVLLIFGGITNLLEALSDQRSKSHH